MKRSAALIAIALCLCLGLVVPLQTASAQPVQTRQLNFVFLHGAGGNVCGLQSLIDSVMGQLPAYIRNYERTTPGVRIQVDTMQRCYRDDADIRTWATNVADSINQHFPHRRNLVLIGHSMGGKAALYAVAKDIGGLAGRVAMVVTINSPIKSLGNYYVAGGGSFLDYCRARWLLTARGVCTSVTYYDSAEDGEWVSRNKHWLAFVSGERAPLSEQFNFGGVDAYPRDMDDGLIPVSAQYSETADIIYYGEHGHSDFQVSSDVSGFITAQILSYIFGGNMECSVFTRGGTLQHQAGWRLGLETWQDLAGDVPAANGTLWHWNPSYTSWREFEDVLGGDLDGDRRSRYEINRVKSTTFLTAIRETRWLSPDNVSDGRLYVKTRVAPRNYIQADWHVYRSGLLPRETKRDRWEVEIATGTPLTQIGGLSWATGDERDPRLRIESKAESPFRWFQGNWRVYSTEVRPRRIIDEMAVDARSSGQPSSRLQSES